MANKITFITENNQTKATFDYDNLPDIQANAIKKVLGITPSGKIDITNTSTYDVTDYAEAQIVDANLTAANIAKDVTILGITGEHEGGQQPTLFAPVVTGGVNEVSWANDSRNGGFNPTITAVVDGQTVTSPLTITQAMDGKTLTITASATNFESAIVTISLEYYQASSTHLDVTYTESTEPSVYKYPAIAAYGRSNCTANTNYYVAAGEDGTNKSLSWDANCYVVATTDGTCSAQLYAWYWENVAGTETGTGGREVKETSLFSGTISVVDASDGTVKNTVTRTNIRNNESSWRITWTGETGKTYYFVIIGKWEG